MRGTWYLLRRDLSPTLGNGVPNDATTFALVTWRPVLYHPVAAAATAFAVFQAAVDVAIAAAAVASESVGTFPLRAID